MTEFFNVIAEFSLYKKTDDLTLDFFDFLSEKYPSIWEQLNMFYADDEYSESFGEEINRQGLCGFEEILDPQYFGEFLQAVKNNWPLLTNSDYGICEYCKEESDLETEHRIIVSYGFGPVVKFYENFEMDGSRFKEVYCCRKCAAGMLKKLVDKMDSEKETCWI